MTGLIERLEGKQPFIGTELRECRDTIEAQDEQITRLKGALSFYADEAAYRDEHPELEATAIEIDCGARARTALDMVKEKNGVE